MEVVCWGEKGKALGERAPLYTSWQMRGSGGLAFPNSIYIKESQ